MEDRHGEEDDEDSKETFETDGLLFAARAKYLSPCHHSKALTTLTRGSTAYTPRIFSSMTYNTGRSFLSVRIRGAEMRIAHKLRCGKNLSTRNEQNADEDLGRIFLSG